MGWWVAGSLVGIGTALTVLPHHRPWSAPGGGGRWVSLAGAEVASGLRYIGRNPRKSPVVIAGVACCLGVFFPGVLAVLAHFLKPGGLVVASIITAILLLPAAGVSLFLMLLGQMNFISGGTPLSKPTVVLYVIPIYEVVWSVVLFVGCAPGLQAVVREALLR